MAFKVRESLDTNIILRVIFGDVEEQCLRIQGLFMRMDISYDVADLAITEAVYVMQDQGCTREQVVDGLKRFFEMPRINANYNLLDKVFPMYLTHPKLSFNDCCLAAYAELNGAEPLWTFDRKLAGQVETAKMVE